MVAYMPTSPCRKVSIELPIALVEQVEDFLEKAACPPGVPFRSWIVTGALRVYLRTALRLLSGEIRSCLDIASIEVDESSRRAVALCRMYLVYPPTPFL